MMKPQKNEQKGRSITHGSNTLPSLTTQLSLPEKTPARLPSPPSGRSRFQQGWTIVRHYPLPLVTLVGLSASLIVWLIERGTLVNWILLTIILVGVLPLLWNALQQFLH